MPISFSDLGGGGGGGGNQLAPITAGYVALSQTFAPGLYAFSARSNTSTEMSGSVAFRGANEALIASITLVDSEAGVTSSAYVGSINLTEEASFLVFQGASANGWLEIAYSPVDSVFIPEVTQLTTTQSGYVLDAESEVFIFGGGGGGGGLSFLRAAAGGGGSGYLTRQVFAAGTYDVVIGAGGAGGGAGDGASIYNGKVGGTSSFGGVTALGGGGGFGGYGGNGTRQGGDGGSGGGGAGNGAGGTNGSNGVTASTAGGLGSGIISPFYLPLSVSGAFYGGGAGGPNNTNLNGTAAPANSAGGGKGAGSADTSNTGGAGGSGVIYIVRS